MDNNLGRAVLVRDIIPGEKSSFPRNFIEFKERLYFTGDNDQNGEELWVSDGTTEGTQLLVDINPGDSSRYRLGTDEDGVNDPDSLYIIPDDSYPQDFFEFNDKLYFSADDGENGRELWVSDGTSDGTQLLADINSGSNDFDIADSSYPKDFAEFNDKLYFTADDGENGEELWVSDGTSDGTQMLLDIYPGADYYGYNFNSYSANKSSPSNFTEFNDKLYFTADDGENGEELWVSDGTSEGTQMLLDINPNVVSDYYDFAFSSYAKDFIEFNDKLYFSADDGENGKELWVSDGTAEGTQMLLDIYSDSSEYASFSSSPDNFIEFNDKLYFSADDGENGKELWVSDGTAEGTQMLLDIYPGYDYGYVNSSSPREFVEFDNKLYFSANDGENGRELWVSDGTAEGTSLAENINLKIDTYGNDFGSNPRDLTVVGDELLFAADDGEVGGELFKLTIDRSQDTDDENDLELPKQATLVIGRGEDVLNGGVGDDTLIGSDVDEEIIGRSGDDYLIGRGGDDLFYGGSGSDTMIGGNGADIFTLEPESGKDIIIDFELGRDRFALIKGLRFPQLSFTKHSIQAGDETIATLVNIDAESLTAEDFTTV